MEGFDNCTWVQLLRLALLILERTNGFCQSSSIYCSVVIPHRGKQYLRLFPHDVDLTESTAKKKRKRKRKKRRQQWSWQKIVSVNKSNRIKNEVKCQSTWRCTDQTRTEHHITSEVLRSIYRQPARNIRFIFGQKTQTDRQTGRQTDRQAGRQRDRQRW